MKKGETKMVTARLPAALVRQLDKAAQKNDRTRSREIAVHLKNGLGRVGSRSAA